MPKKKQKNPLICQKCHHNMSRSRVKMDQSPMTVRCGKCKTVYVVSLIPPQEKEFKVAK